MLLICAMSISAAGCGAIIVGGAAAAGTYFYLDGQSRGTYSVSLNKAYEASLAACKELEIPVTEQSKKLSSATVTGKLSGDTVTISLKLVGDDITEITVRVGLMGDESASYRIQKTISKRF